MPSTTCPKIFDIAEEISPPQTFGPVESDIPYERIYGSLELSPKCLKEARLEDLISQWLRDFNKLLQNNFKDEELSSKLIMPHASWKDHMCLSWELHQFHYLENINRQLTHRQPDFKLSEVSIDTKADLERIPKGYYVQTMHELTIETPPIEFLVCFIKFETKFGFGKGVIRLVAVHDSLKLLTFFTTLEQLKGHPEKIGASRPEGVNHGQNVGRKIWLEQRAKDFQFGGTKQPTVLIVGGGQSGLATAARLKLIGVDSLIVEKNAKIGDNWRKRYSFLVLHDPVWADHLPYLNFPEFWPIYTPKDKLGDWFQSYADFLELSYWTNKSVSGAKYSVTEKKWQVEIIDNETNEMTTLSPKHVVMATGHSGEPNIPHFPGEEVFKGTIVHSSQHKTGLEYRGEKALVVGSCNSAHDIAQDFYEQGANVTMLQRSSTCVINVDRGASVINKGVYEQDAPPIETADLIAQSNPVPFLNLMHQQIFRKTVEMEKDMIERLTLKGFKLDSGYGHTGLLGKYLRRGGGYYIDVGGSSLIVEDKIHLRQGVEIQRFFEKSVQLTDGSIIDDVKTVVLATGYLNMKTTANKIFGEQIAGKLKDVWGFNDEGELNAVFTDSGHENFWFAGGNLALVRYLSKKLALRILAQELGPI